MGCAGLRHRACRSAILVFSPEAAVPDTTPILHCAGNNKRISQGMPFDVEERFIATAEEALGWNC